MSSVEDAEAIHREAIVVVGHSDIIASNVDYFRATGERRVLERRHLPTLRQGGATVICDHLGGDTRYAYLPAIALTTSPLRRIMRVLDHAHCEAKESEAIVLVDTVDDIRRAKREGKIALVLCIEGASPLEDDLSYLRNFHRLGVRSLGLTHNWRNQVADGVMERSGGGLTHFGADVVRECQSLGILVDVSHLSDRGLEDVLAISTRPIIASHSNARALRNHVRNLTDDQIRAIAQRGGVVGIHALNALVSDAAEPGIGDVVQHIQHIANVGGIDCVGIGPDLMENWREDLYRSAAEGAQTFMSVPVKKMNFCYPKGFSSLAELPNITKGLVAVGFSRQDIEKVLGGNFMRLYAQMWPGRETRA